jgi:dTDP-4-amino-4,6-dideoxygalactose transaminase
VHFIPIHHHPHFRRVLEPEVACGFPAADAASGEIVSLPLYPSLSDDQVARVCAEIDRARRPAVREGSAR